MGQIHETVEAAGEVDIAAGETPPRAGPGLINRYTLPSAEPQLVK